MLVRWREREKERESVKKEHATLTSYTTYCLPL